MAEGGKRGSYWNNIYYIFILQGLGSAIVSGGIEFAIAYGMYWKQRRPITLWAFPHTLSGDCALSLFIQVGITWFMEETFIGWDCFKNKTPLVPFELPLPDKVKHKYIWKYLEIEYGIPRDEDMKKNTRRNYMRKQWIQYPNRSIFFNLFQWSLRKFIRAMIAAALIWAIEWPVTMGIMAGIGTRVGSHDYKYHGWTPQIMKMIYAFVLGIISTPAAIIVIMIRDKWYLDYMKQLETNTSPNEKNLERQLCDEDSTISTNENNSVPSSSSRKSHNMNLPV